MENRFSWHYAWRQKLLGPALCHLQVQATPYQLCPLCRQVLLRLPRCRPWVFQHCWSEQLQLLQPAGLNKSWHLNAYVEINCMQSGISHVIWSTFNASLHREFCYKYTISNVCWVSLSHAVRRQTHERTLVHSFLFSVRIVCDFVLRKYWQSYWNRMTKNEKFYFCATIRFPYLCMLCWTFRRGSSTLVANPSRPHRLRSRR